MNEKEKIVNYSKDVFFKRGFYKITMDEIASKLRISKKTIYKHFFSKEKLVDAAVELFQKNLKKEINSILSTKENSIFKIKALTKIFAELSIKVDEQMLYDLQSHRPDLWERIDQFRGNIIREVWVDIINAGKQEKCIIDKPNEMIITIILSSLRGTINPLFLLHHNYSVKEAFEIVFDILINGILTEKGKILYYKSIMETENEK